MEVEIGRGKKGRRAYGFDDIAIVPSRRTRDPDDIDIAWMLGPYRLELPLLASAMDGVVSPETAGDPRQARRPGRPEPRGDLDALRGRRRAARADRRLPKEQATGEMQRIYAEPIKEELIGSASVRSRSTASWRRRRSRRSGSRSTTRTRSRPGSTSSSSRARSSRPSTCRRHTEPLNLKEFIREVPIAGDRRRLRVLLHRPAPHAHRRRRRCSSESARARPAPRRGVLGIGVPAGHRDRRRRAPPARSTCSRPAST